MAKKLGTNPNYLSKVVNQYMKMSFSEYSNKLKIAKIVALLKERKHLRNYTIDALAKEIGYKSTNAFNSNFKKLLKVTPSQFLKKLKSEDPN